MPACPAFAEAASRRQAKRHFRVQAWGNRSYMKKRVLAKDSLAPSQVAEKVVLRRLLKNAQMQGPRNPGKRDVLGGTLQQACPVLDTGMDEGNPAKRGTDERFSAACWNSFFIPSIGFVTAKTASGLRHLQQDV